MSLRGTVETAHKKMKEGCRSIEVEPSMDKNGKHDGGFISTMHMHDYDHLKNGLKMAHNSHHEVARHIRDVFGGAAEGKKDNEEED